MLLSGRREFLGYEGHLWSQGLDFAAIVTPTGELLFLRGDPSPGLWAVRFDMTRRRVEGAPVLVAPQAVSMSVSEDRSLLYVEGSGDAERRELVWVDRSGKVIEPVGSAHAGLADATLSPDGRPPS